MRPADRVHTVASECVKLFRHFLLGVRITPGTQKLPWISSHDLPPRPVNRFFAPKNPAERWTRLHQYRTLGADVPLEPGNGRLWRRRSFRAMSSKSFIQKNSTLAPRLQPQNSRLILRAFAGVCG